MNYVCCSGEYFQQSIYKESVIFDATIHLEFLKFVFACFFDIVLPVLQITTGYKTPSVKSLLDTTRVQKTVGSVPSTPSPTTVANSVIGLVQYNPNFIAKSGATQGYAALTQALVTQASTISANASKPAAKTITLTSPTAKVIDLTEDDDSKNQTRFLTIPNVNPGMRAVLPPGTQLVRSGLPNNQTYQVVFSPPSAAIRPGTVTVAPALSQSSVPTVLQTLPNQASQQQQTITPGTTMARAAVPAIPPTVVQVITSVNVIFYCLKVYA